MKRQGLLICFLVIFLFVSRGIASETFHLVILHTNDTHGHPVKFRFGKVRWAGGIPARATVIKKIREKNSRVMLLDAGDINTGMPESDIFKARPDIEGYNYIGYDAMCIGNHEFDNPLDVLKEQMNWARFPFLSANIRYKGGGEYLARPYIIKDIKGLRVAIFGLTLKETPFKVDPSHVKDLIFEDEVRTASNLIPQLRQKADLIIALTHLGIFDNPDEGSRRVARYVKGIDVIVDGHSHTKIDKPIVETASGSRKPTLIVQAWKWGLILGRLDLWIRDKRIIKYRFRNIPINLSYRGPSILEDRQLLSILNKYVEKAGRDLNRVIGRALKNFFMKGSRSHETAIGDLVADSMLWFTKEVHHVDFAINNGGGIRADIPRGNITKRIIHEVIPFDNTVVVLNIKGYQLKSLLSRLIESGEGGGFPQVSDGVEIIVNGKTGRCERIIIGGRPINPLREYRIATNSYLAKGGDGYIEFLNARRKYDTSAFQRDVLIQYIEHLGRPISPVIKGRIRFIKPSTEMRERAIGSGMSTVR